MRYDREAVLDWLEDEVARLGRIVETTRNYGDDYLAMQLDAVASVARLIMRTAVRVGEDADGAEWPEFRKEVV